MKKNYFRNKNFGSTLEIKRNFFLKGADNREIVQRNYTTVSNIN